MHKNKEGLAVTYDDFLHSIEQPSLFDLMEQEAI